MKFGGTLMGTPEAVAASAKLVRDTPPPGEQVIVVVSAMAGVTEALLALAYTAERGELGAVQSGVTQLRARHLAAAEALDARAPTPYLESALREVRDLTDTLRQTVTGVSLLRELSARSRDLIVSFGERLSAPLMSLALEQLGARNHHLTGGQAGLLTDAVFGGARPLPEAAERLRERLGGLLAAGLTPVIAGFIGETRDGVVTTLGRGGTDYTATIVGAALGAREVWAWKDVDGVMTADPRLVPGARNLARLSYAEVMELAYFGAKVLHPLAVTPLQEKGIPLRVKSAADPSFAGTLVSETTPADAAHPVKAVTAIRGLAILTVSGAGMVGAPEVFSQLFGILGREGVSVQMISQGNSQANLSLVAGREGAGRAATALRRDLPGAQRDYDLQLNVAVVAVVGEGMRGTPGVAARLFSALGAAGVNLLMIAQGSSELNISFAVEEREVEDAVRAAHAAFDLGN